MDILPRRENDRIVNLVFSESFTIDPTEIIGARSRFVEYGEIFPVRRCAEESSSYLLTIPLVKDLFQAVLTRFCVSHVILES